MNIPAFENRSRLALAFAALFFLALPLRAANPTAPAKGVRLQDLLGTWRGDLDPSAGFMAAAPVRPDVSPSDRPWMTSIRFQTNMFYQMSLWDPPRFRFHSHRMERYTLEGDILWLGGPGPLIYYRVTRRGHQLRLQRVTGPSGKALFGLPSATLWPLRGGLEHSYLSSRHKQR